MRNESMLCIRALIGCVLLSLAAAGKAAAPEVQTFVGEYEGEAISANGGDISTRDLRVKISATQNGFIVNWISVTKRPDGKLKRKQYSIEFHPTRRKNIFRSGERKDMFGNLVPLDPMEGDPYVWARIHEKTLTVYAVHVLEDGGYEIQTYARTRIPTGLSLKYSRVRDGKVLSTVEGTLLEVK